MNYESYIKRALFVMVVLYVVYHVDAIKSVVVGV